MTVTTHDLMGNLCIEGGAEVTGELQGKHASKKVKVNVTDNADGTYYLHWRSDVSGTYTAAIRIYNEHVLGSPATIQLTAIAPQLSKTELAGSGLTACVAGTVSTFTLKFYDQFDNPAQPLPSFCLGLALLQNRARISSRSITPARLPNGLLARCWGCYTC